MSEKRTLSRLMQNNQMIKPDKTISMETLSHSWWPRNEHF